MTVSEICHVSCVRGSSWLSPKLVKPEIWTDVVPVTSGGLVESSVRPSVADEVQAALTGGEALVSGRDAEARFVEQGGGQGEVVGDDERVIRALVGPRSEALKGRRRQAFDLLPAEAPEERVARR